MPFPVTSCLWKTAFFSPGPLQQKLFIIHAASQPPLVDALLGSGVSTAWGGGFSHFRLRGMTAGGFARAKERPRIGREGRGGEGGSVSLPPTGWAERLVAPEGKGWEVLQLTLNLSLKFQKQKRPKQQR